MLVRISLSLAALLALAPVGCGRASNGRAAADSMTTRQRDSALGTSRVPGATGITRALSASDSADARNAKLDSLASQP